MSEVKKVLFLDIDGVLNYNQFYVRTRKDGITYPVSELCPLAIEQLNRIVAETRCSVVVSSTWRHSGIQYCRDVLKEAGYMGDIHSITPDIHDDWAERGNEILKWLKDNKLYKYDSYCKVDRDYAILDDDTDMLYQQKDNFFVCDPDTGLTVNIADRVIQFLLEK